MDCDQRLIDLWINEEQKKQVAKTKKAYEMPPILLTTQDVERFAGDTKNT